MSQHKIILELLNEGRWVCTNEMYAKFIADPRTRLCELKKQGYDLTPRPCENPAHNHKGGSKEWYLNLSTNKFPIVKQFREEYQERMANKVKVAQGLF